MEWLNYHHLLYFWTVVREGGVSRAAEKLRLAQPTISAQVKALEDAFGQRLFDRQGRRLVLTDAGRLVYRYADEIFGIGRELLETMKGRAPGRPVEFAVGVANSVSKLIVRRLLKPALEADAAVRLPCREDGTNALLAELATHDLDVVIADVPAPPHVRVKVFSHLLGESDVTFFAAAPLAARLRRRFPQSLDGAPMLLPSTGSALRRSLDQWMDDGNLHPHIVGEFDDSALMKAFAQGGAGVFPAPSVIASEVVRQYRVQAVGQATGVHERYYAISVERRLKHPAVLALTKAARHDFLG